MAMDASKEAQKPTLGGNSLDLYKKFPPNIPSKSAAYNHIF